MIFKCWQSQAVNNYANDLWKRDCHGSRPLNLRPLPALQLTSFSAVLFLINFLYFYHHSCVPDPFFVPEIKNVDVFVGAVWTLIHTYNTRRQGCENGPWTSYYCPHIWLCTGTLSAHRRWSMREWALSPLPCGFKAHTEQNRNSKVTTSPFTCRLKASTSRGGHVTLTSSAPWVIFCSSSPFNFSLQLIASPISGPLFIWKILTPWVISLWWEEEGNELQLSPRCLSTMLLTLSLCILHTAIGQKVLRVIVVCWGRDSCVLWESLI